MSLCESFDFFEGGIGVAKIAFYLDCLVFFMKLYLFLKNAMWPEITSLLVLCTGI